MEPHTDTIGHLAAYLEPFFVWFHQLGRELWVSLLKHERSAQSPSAKTCLRSAAPLE